MGDTEVRTGVGQETEGQSETVGKSPYCGLHLKGTLMDELFTLSRNSPTLDGAVPPRSARSQMSKHQN